LQPKEEDSIRGVAENDKESHRPRDDKGLDRRREEEFTMERLKNLISTAIQESIEKHLNKGGGGAVRFADAGK